MHISVTGVLGPYREPPTNWMTAAPARMTTITIPMAAQVPVPMGAEGGRAVREAGDARAFVVSRAAPASSRWTSRRWAGRFSALTYTPQWGHLGLEEPMDDNQCRRGV